MTDISTLQIHGITAAVALHAVASVGKTAYEMIRDNGGLVGIWRSFLYGKPSKPEVAQLVSPPETPKETPK
jgi:hypothetical protein